MAIDRCSNIWAYCRALLVVSSAHKADSPIAKFKVLVQRLRLMYEQQNIAIISRLLVICIIVCLSWAVNHYRDNANTYKAQRDKNARELEAGERGNY